MFKKTLFCTIILIIIVSSGLILNVSQNNFKAQAQTLTRSSVSQNGITWTFDRAYQVGQFYFGDWWVIGPVTIISVSPAWDGTRHGSMLNPDSSVEAQGYRTGMDMSFNISLRVTFPVTLSDISSLVSTIGKDTITTGGCHDGIKAAAVLTVVNTPPPANSFRPPYSQGNKPIYQTSQMRLDLLPRLPVPPHVSDQSYDFDNYNNSMTKVWIDHSRGGGNRGATIHPTDNMPCYGRNSSIEVSHLANMALLDIPQADEMAKRLTQLGIDHYNNWLRNAGDIHGGGFGHGRKWPIIFAGIMLDDTDMQHPPLYRSGVIYKFIEDRYTYYGSNGTPYWGTDCANGDGGACRVSGGDASSGYRTCCSVLTWTGQALAARIMNAMDLWGHDAYFDYIDRWEREMNNVRRADYYCYGGALIEDMWKAYRDYSPPANTRCVQDLNGHVCSQNQTCPGSWLNASDTNRCCSQNCEDLNQLPQIALTKTADKTQATPGDEIKYTIHYHNISQTTAYNLKITDNIPAGTTYLSGGQLSGNTVTWDLGDVEAGIEADVILRVKAD